MNYDYINSGGNELPKDIDDYKQGNLLENICALCKKSHDNHPLLYIPHDIRRASKTGAHICAVCQNEVEDMIHAAHGFEYSDLENIMKTSKKPVTIPFSMREDEDKPKSMREEDEEYKTMLKKIKKDFVEKLVFPIDIYKHLQHLDNLSSLYAEDYPDRCAFCKTKYRNGSNVEFVDVPVDSGKFLNGGQVIICHDCHSSLSIDIAYLYDKLETRGELRKFSCSSKVHTNGKTCNNTYYTNAEEGTERDQCRHFKDFLCPECAYNDAISAPIDNLKFIAENVEPSNDRERRWRTMHCMCGQHVDIDLCVGEMSLLEHYLAHKNDRQYVLCDSCHDVVKEILEDTKSVLFRYHETYFVIYFAENKATLIMIGGSKITELKSVIVGGTSHALVASELMAYIK